MKKFRDIAGRELVVDDIVASTVTNYSELRLCKIIGFTAQKVRVQQLKNTVDNYDSSPQLKTCGQLCWVDPNLVVMKVLKNTL